MNFRLLVTALVLSLSTIAGAAAQAEDKQVDQVDSERAAAARRVVIASHLEESFLRNFDRMIPLMLHPLAEARGLTADEEARVAAALSEEVRVEPGPLIDMLAQVYALHMTAEDLNALADFYESPVGVRVLAATPEIENESAAVASRWAAEVFAPRVVQRLQAPPPPAGPT